MNRRFTASLLLVFAVVLSGLNWRSQAQPAVPTKSLEHRFTERAPPLFEKYCFSCHGPKKQEASLDLSKFAKVNELAKHLRHWELVLERLHSEEMPPEEATRHPTAEEREFLIQWIRDLQDREAKRNAGDPGLVLARRLSNAELDYTIRDLTGVDIRPAKEFPVDPSNEAGFDNSGESLAMSPALLRKYLAAARHIANHVVLKPEGFVFAPYPVVTETDRDKYCVQRIVDFYQRHAVDYADYLFAAWKLRHRDRFDVPEDLKRLAADSGLSPRYLEKVHSALTSPESDVGPMAAVRVLWNRLPQDASARAGCEQLRDVIVRLRGALKPNVKKLSVKGISPGSQPFVLWRNRETARLHHVYAGDPGTDLKKLGDSLKISDDDIRKLLATDADGARAGLDRFCSTFPAAFVVIDRGPYFDPNAAGKGVRPLTAGFHLMHGHFRDDQPLYDLILTDSQRREIDALWHELDFITLSPMRQYADFIFFERAEPPRFMFEGQFDFARSEDRDASSEPKMNRLAKLYLAKATQRGADADAVSAITTYFADISAAVRRVEKARIDAERGHLDALFQFAERAQRRPISQGDRDDLRAFYRMLRTKDELGHEEALRDTLVTVLLSPHFTYRYDLASPGPSPRPLDDYGLASRLSYFLWSSMPDAELLGHAAAGDLHRPEVLTVQTRRLLQDPRVRGLATEFAGNWLDIRRFEEHNSVDRKRFESFTPELRQAMYEEPIRYFIDVVQKNRPVTDLLYGHDTFVNRPLARHYGMPEPRGDEWVHVTDARPHGRGGLLPMAVFLTKNAPGLRTSPVKRGYWVVRRVLGESIPPPPPTVPELPKDEANLGELTLAETLARHRQDKACAGCHRRFDAVGLVFENFGPIGERRMKDLGGRPVEIAATFPDGKERRGLSGLQEYLRERRNDDFVDHLCRKLFSYALGRGLVPSDRPALEDMKTRLRNDRYAPEGLIESIVTSRQFLTRRGNDSSTP